MLASDVHDSVTVKSDDKKVPNCNKMNRWRGKSHMGLKCIKIIFSSLLITLVFAGCGLWQKRDIEDRLISEMTNNCKKVVIKMDYDKGVYVMTYTGEVSKDGCPVALLQGWKDERLIKEKKLEICGCKETNDR